MAILSVIWGSYLSPLTALAITRSETMSADVDWTLMSSLARVDSGMVSVGLKAEEFVSETYR